MEFTEENFRKLANENRQLRQRVDWLIRKLFGRSSEKLNPNQLAFDLGENGVAPDAPEAPLEADEVMQTRVQRKRGKRMALPADLPVVEERIIPDEVLAEPEAYKRKRPIGDPLGR